MLEIGEWVDCWYECIEDQCVDCGQLEDCEEVVCGYLVVVDCEVGEQDGGCQVDVVICCQFQ